EPIVGGKSQSAVQRLLAGLCNMLRSGAGLCLLFHLYRLSFPPPRNDLRAHNDECYYCYSIADPAATANERLIGSSVFGGDSSFAGGSHPISVGFSDHTGSDFLIVISLSAEVRMRAEYNIKEKMRLKSLVEENDVLIKSRCDELEILKAQLIVKEAEAAKVVHLAALVKVREQEVTDLDAVVTSVKLQNDSLVDQIKEVNEKFDKLCVDFVDMALHLEEKFYLRLLTTLFGRRWLLTHGMELTISKCLNSTEYISTLGAAIGKAIEKGMQEGLSAANKDASVEVILNLLLLEDNLAEKLGLVKSQPHADQQMVHIHQSPDQRVVALRGVFVPLSEPLSAMALEDDYEIAHTEGGEGVVVNVNP
nr:hypothetical protein [Tanacetum cinerariifolium]